MYIFEKSEKIRAVEERVASVRGLREGVCGCGCGAPITGVVLRRGGDGGSEIREKGHRDNARFEDGQSVVNR